VNLRLCDCGKTLRKLDGPDLYECPTHGQMLARVRAGRVQLLRIAKQEGDADGFGGPSIEELNGETERRVSHLQTREPQLSRADALQRAYSGWYEDASGRRWPTLHHAFAAALEPVGKRHAERLTPLLAQVVTNAAGIATLEAELAKRRNPPQDAPPNERSKYNGPAARALGELAVRQRRELAELDARGAGRAERNRVTARHTRELDAARARAAVEAFKHPDVVKAYQDFDAASRRARED